MLKAVCGALALAVFAGLADAALLEVRLHHTSVKLHHTKGKGTTWLLVGSDARDRAPGTASQFGTAQQVPGERADVVLLVHLVDGHASVVSVPRDLIVSPAEGQIDRLALTLNRSPQQLADGLCTTLHVGADHLAILTMAGLAGIVDDLGGVSVAIEAPVRDRVTGLELPRAGRQQLGGAQALALVRSRHPEHYVGGRWRPVDEVAGAQARTASAGLVFAALAKAARDAAHSPWTLQHTAWTATGDLTTDPETGILDLLSLARGLRSSRSAELPVRHQGDVLAVTATQASQRLLLQEGLAPTC